MEIKQVRIIYCVIETLGLDDGRAKRKFIPSESKPLVKDADGSAPCGTFSYSSVVGMLTYLSGHTHPYIVYAVNCCARYMFCPKNLHETSLKSIGHYLKATCYKGLILNPSSYVCKLDWYPDADSTKMYGHEIPTDPACVKNILRFVNTFTNFPVYWASKLQTETALSTIEWEINDLSHSCIELFPIIDITKSLGRVVGLPIGDTTMNVSIHKDNTGASNLEKTLPPQITPNSKYYASKIIWFYEEINKGWIKLLKIDTLEQMEDIFTKILPRATNEYLQKKIIAW